MTLDVGREKKKGTSSLTLSRVAGGSLFCSLRRRAGTSVPLARGIRRGRAVALAKTPSGIKRGVLGEINFFHIQDRKLLIFV